MLEETLFALVREGFEETTESNRPTLRSEPEWRKVRQTGTSLWLDTGDIEEAAKLFTMEFEALTTNNTLLNNEVQKGIYDELVGETAKVIRETQPGISESELVLEIAFVLNARHALKLVEQFGANVSVELHTDLAHDVERSIAYGRRFYAICPEKFIIKVPLTPAGLLSARALAEEGIPINFTLGFSARQNYVIARFTKPNYVNVFMGRLGAFLADNDLGPGDCIGEKATLATQREVLALRESGESPSRLIGASMRSSAQVAALAGLDVFTMPTKVAAQYLESPAETVSSRIQDDPDVPLADGVRFEDFNANTLWDVPDDLRKAVNGLVAQDSSSLSPAAIEDHFANAGIGDLFPRWSEADLETVTKDGKIPVYETWKERLQAKAIGFDALMNLSALHSFVTDQKALDDRIRSFL